MSCSKRTDVVIVGVSPEPPEVHAKMKKNYGQSHIVFLDLHSLSAIVVEYFDDNVCAFSVQDLYLCMCDKKIVHQFRCLCTSACPRHILVCKHVSTNMHQNTYMCRISVTHIHALT